MAFDLSVVLNDIADAIEKEIDALAKEDATDNPEQDVKTEPEAPVEGTEPVDELSVEGLALEAIRILQLAEKTDYVDESDSLIRIADRYIRLTELAITANINL
jgi:hypothetical protein